MKRNQSTPRIIILLLFLCILFCSCGKAKPASSESALDAARAKEAERNAEREKEEQEEAQREHHKKLAEGNVELSTRDKKVSKTVKVEDIISETQALIKELFDEINSKVIDR